MLPSEQVLQAVERIIAERDKITGIFITTEPVSAKQAEQINKFLKIKQ